MASNNADAQVGFPLFPLLPPEIRQKIFLECLPTSFGPALYDHKNSSWCHTRVATTPYTNRTIRDLLLQTTRGRVDFIQRRFDAATAPPPPRSSEAVVHEVAYTMLASAPVDLPVAAVNHEGLETALRWARQNPELMLHVVEQQQGRPRALPRICRLFWPKSDVVYSSSWSWDIYPLEIEDGMTVLEWSRDGTYLEKRMPCFHAANVAIPEACLASGRGMKRHLFELVFKLEALYVVRGPQPPCVSRWSEQRRWELRPVEGYPDLIWDEPGWHLKNPATDRGMVDSDDGFYQQMRWLMRTLHRLLYRRRDPSPFLLRVVSLDMDGVGNV